MKKIIKTVLIIIALLFLLYVGIILFGIFVAGDKANPVNNIENTK